MGKEALPNPVSGSPLAQRVYDGWQLGMMLGVVYGSGPWTDLMSALRASSSYVAQAQVMQPGLLGTSYKESGLLILSSGVPVGSAALLIVGAGAHDVGQEYMMGNPDAFAGMTVFESGHTPWAFTWGWGPDGTVESDFARLFEAGVEPSAQDWTAFFSRP